MRSPLGSTLSMPDQPTTAAPDQHELRKLRRRSWVLLSLTLLGFVFMSVTLVPWLVALGIRFPDASLPATLSAGIGIYQVRRRTHGVTLPGSVEALMRRENQLAEPALWGIVGGALGYAGFAAFGIGVPTPDAPLAWRVFGGAVFGAAAGVAAGWIGALVVLVPTLISIARALLRPRRAA